MDDRKITSDNFNYDEYSGVDTSEYLRQANEQKRMERERAGKTEAELKREVYEKRFSGMSADEIFSTPAPKKKPPQEDYSDFFNSDAAAKEATRSAFDISDLHII
ncbi:MAG: hypothetical protein IKN17_05480 [Ruminococcus sp.]|nr:hypothetical protein [Ruminococcus sp.]